LDCSFPPKKEKHFELEIMGVEYSFWMTPLVCGFTLGVLCHLRLSQRGWEIERLIGEREASEQRKAT
jgi:hypothetical protein